MTSSLTTSDATCPPRRWTPATVAALLSMCLLMSLVSLTYVMMIISLPTLSAHYRTIQSAWVPTAFLLVGAVTAPLIGRLADGRGKRRILLGCITLAALGAFVAAAAPSFGFTVLGCALLGLLNPSVFLGYTLILDVFPTPLRAVSASIAMGCLGLATMYAPFLAGWLIDDFGFGAVFWFVGCAAIPCALCIRATMGESHTRRPVPLDVVGAVLLGASIAGILLGVSFAPRSGWTGPRTVASLVAGCAIGAIWVLRSRRLEHPLIDLKLLTNRAVILISLTSGIAFATGAVFVVILPYMAMTPPALHLGYGFGLDSMSFAWIQAPMGAGSFVAAFATGLLAGRVSPRGAMIAGLILNIVAAAAAIPFHGVEGAVIALAALMGLGSGCTHASIPNLIAACVPPEVHATVGAIAGVIQAMVPAVVVVMTFTVLNFHIATEVSGRVFYSDQGISLGFLIAVLIGVAGVVAAWLLPRGPRDQLVGKGSSGPPLTAGTSRSGMVETRVAA